MEQHIKIDLAAQGWYGSLPSVCLAGVAQSRAACRSSVPLVLPRLDPRIRS
jgi:hypothetical protein